MSELVFGNPWHGKLRPGQIELEAGVPVSSVTLGGLPATIKTVDGNLGVTRYHKAPGLPTPPANAEITAAKGALTNDFILFSSQFRYSPVSTASVLASDMEWLLFDGAAQRWRKMSMTVSVNNEISKTYSAQSPAGTRVIQITVSRKAIYGDIDRIQGESGPSVPPMTQVGSQDIPLIYAYSPLHRPTPSSYNPSQLLWSIDPAPDGRKILLRLEALRWDGFSSAHTGDSLFNVYDASQTWLFGVWEISFAADGTTMQTAVPVWPDRPAPPAWPDYMDFTLSTAGGVSMEVTPSVEFPDKNIVDYWIPVSVAQTGKTINQFDTSIMINAAYDKDGVIQLTHFRMYSDNSLSYVYTFDAFLGRKYVLKTEDPATQIPDHNFTTTPIRREPWSVVGGVGIAAVIMSIYPQIKNMRNNASTGGVNFVQKLEVAKGSDVLKSWTGKFSGAMRWRWKSNNVVELYVGTESKLRVGPGVVDDSPVSINGFSTYNPRTGQLLSSNTPVGWV